MRSLTVLLILAIVACKEAPKPEPESAFQRLPFDLRQDSIRIASGMQAEQLDTLILSDSTRFPTTLYEVQVLGALRTTRKYPYLVLSGRGCTDCDANISIHVHSPSDGPMKGEATQDRYAFPGREDDYEEGTPLFESRVFIGDCVSQHANAVLWFQHSYTDGQKGPLRVFAVEVRNDSLIGHMLDPLPSIAEAIAAATSAGCREIPGSEYSSEP